MRQIKPHDCFLSQNEILHSLVYNVDMKPFYQEGNDLVSVSNSILRHYGLETYHESLKPLDEILDNTDKKICILLLDGFGTKIRELHYKYSKFIWAGKFHTITSVFPPTTVAATTALLSSLYPCETGWLGWSQKFPEIEDDILMFASECKRKKEEKLPFSTWKRLSYLSLVDRLNQSGKKACKIQSFVYKKDRRYKTFFNETDKAIKENDFVYAYQTEPDASLHKYGVKSRRVSKVIKRLTKETKKLVQNNPDTLFLILADHGHRNTSYRPVEEHPDFYSLLAFPSFSIEPRASAFFVKEGKKEEFRKLAKKYYGNDFYILGKKEVIESKIFGIGKEYELFPDLIGDFVLISKGDALFSDKDSHLYKSQHAGSTDEEMLIDISVFHI